MANGSIRTLTVLPVSFAGKCALAISSSAFHPAG